ncbi:MAG TPA: 2-oxoglutarate dehydrogenase E1 component [Bacteroidales bacterium]|nr:2-oxoglutarate dehydrogenase E1 component [Bacteroidales bacterium]HPM92148.1 2-oxoglutarate dehydrogenase E1 component [Bacteroidales bacterium]
MDRFSYLNANDPAMIEALYEKFQADPASVDEGWRQFFEGFEFARKHYPVRKQEGIAVYPSEFKVINLINAYRQRGHLFTQTNPVRTRRKYSPTLDIENFGLNNEDLSKSFEAGHEIGIGKATLKEITDHLKETYCQSVGAEFFYIRNPEVKTWLQDKMERSRNSYPFTLDDRKYIYRDLARAVLFEKFIHKKFPGQKRFSLEGAEALIPALDAIMEKGALLGTEEFIIGMPHRGRLNVLANILRKPYSHIFSEFRGMKYEDETLLGDVKYHLGYTIERYTTAGKKMKLTLAPNPSHLEAVDPVVEGIVRARADMDYKGDFNRIAPILIHGDASVAGQGIVYEVIQMSQLPGYKTGGTIHVVVNNQIGFTTNYLDARSSTYCTDVAKVVQSPVFHVNGDDVEAIVATIQLAMEFRAKFQRDVFLDILCYRKYGHNEGDEPRFTQPILYKIIETHPNPMEIYRRQLIEKGFLEASYFDEVEAKIHETLEKDLEESRKIDKANIRSFLDNVWKDIRKATPADFDTSPETGVDLKKIKSIGRRIAHVPEGENYFRKLVRLQESRLEMIEKTGQVDWAMGELLAYGTLLEEGFPVRISGQDSIRGTFSHRHAVLKIEDSEKEYYPLAHISDRQARFEVYNSPLSEYGVLGFDYGYSLASPQTLTIWEAQFGDFANTAQVIFDQFICSAEDKWNVMNDLVILLPHGYEGQGPEHSSARIERFLILSAEYNMQVANVTTPANFFHLIRRQLHREFRKPLIVFTPKSLLRHARCISPLTDLASGSFREVIDDPDADQANIKKVVFCTGKVYYDLLEEKEKMKYNDTAIIRIEQLHPFPYKQIRNILDKYLHTDDILWTQEEPANMGAWTFIQTKMQEFNLRLIARPASGSPATGSPEFHELQQRKVIEKTFSSCDCPKVAEECRMMCIGNRWKTFEEQIMKTGQHISSKSVSAINKLQNK